MESQALIQRGWRVLGESQRLLQECQLALERSQQARQHNPHGELRRAILALHDSRARHLCSVQVSLCEGERVLWTGVVHEYHLLDHPSARACYAWTELVGGRWQCYSMLKQPPVHSAQDAVRLMHSAAANPLGSNTLEEKEPSRQQAG